MAQHDFIARLIDGLARGGARRAVLSPGYRSAPLAFAIAEHPAITTEVIVDERAAAFYALGLARVLDAPVVLACTSGSAVANYLPAVVEAYHARIPLILLTADRPPELQRSGAPQTILQVDLFRDFVVHRDELAQPAALDLDIPPDRDPWAPRVAAALLAAADPGGPVHLNIPLRKPLIPPTPAVQASPAPSTAPASAHHEPPSRALPRLHRGARRLSAAALTQLADRFAQAARPLLFAGPQISSLGEREAEALVGLAARSRWPLLADLLAPARPWALQRGDLIARAPARAPAPDAILWFGGAPTSAAVQRWIQRCPGPVVHVVPDGRWADPSFTATDLCWADAAELASELELPPAAAAWRAQWSDAARAADAHLAAAAQLGRWEGAIIDLAFRTWPGRHVHIANSSAVRDLDAVAALAPGQRVLCNRGVNGIDGTLATAAGEAAGLAAPLLAIVGDLALAHDLGALLHAADPRLVVLVLDNGGGQIFRQLPLRDHPDFERLFVTRAALGLADLAAATGWRHRRADDAAALTEALTDGHARGRLLIEVVLDPHAAHAARERFWATWS